MDEADNNAGLVRRVFSRLFQCLEHGEASFSNGWNIRRFRSCVTFDVNMMRAARDANVGRPGLFGGSSIARRAGSIVLCMLGSVQMVQAVDLFNKETMYNGSGGASGNSIAVHESNNRFENDALTMSGTGDMRTTSASSGYTGASGTWNVMVNASGENFIIADINSVGYTNMMVFFGIRKNSTSENGSTMAIDASTNGTDWVSCGSISLPTGTGTATWYYRTNAVPDSMAGSNLRLRF